MSLLTSALLLTSSHACPDASGVRPAVAICPIATAHLRLAACLSHDLEALQVQAQHGGELAHCQLLLGHAHGLAAAVQCKAGGQTGCTRGDDISHFQNLDFTHVDMLGLGSR